MKLVLGAIAALASPARSLMALAVPLAERHRRRPDSFP